MKHRLFSPGRDDPSLLVERRHGKIVLSRFSSDAAPAKRRVDPEWQRSAAALLDWADRLIGEIVYDTGASHDFEPSGSEHCLACENDDAPRRVLCEVCGHCRGCCARVQRAERFIDLDELRSRLGLDVPAATYAARLEAERQRLLGLAASIEAGAISPIWDWQEVLAAEEFAGELLVRWPDVPIEVSRTKLERRGFAQPQCPMSQLWAAMNKLRQGRSLARDLRESYARQYRDAARRGGTTHFAVDRD